MRISEMDLLQLVANANKDLDLSTAEGRFQKSFIENLEQLKTDLIKEAEGTYIGPYPSYYHPNKKKAREASK